MDQALVRPQLPPLLLGASASSPALFAVGRTARLQRRSFLADASEPVGSRARLETRGPPIYPRKKTTPARRKRAVCENLSNSRKADGYCAHLLSGGYRSTNSRSVQETRFERECFGEQKEAEGPGEELVFTRASIGNADKALNARRNPSVADAAATGACLLYTREETSPLSVSPTYGLPGAARTLHVRAGCTRQTARGALSASTGLPY